MEIIHFNEDSLKDVLGTKKTVLIDFLQHGADLAKCYHQY